MYYAKVTAWSGRAEYNYDPYGEISHWLLDISSDNFASWYCQSMISGDAFIQVIFTDANGSPFWAVPHQIGYGISTAGAGIYHYGRLFGGLEHIAETSSTRNSLHLSSIPYDLDGRAV